jgi:Putative Flp pilus-assembly TadE/G-like
MVRCHVRRTPVSSSGLVVAVKQEQGGVLVMVALLLPVLILFVSFVVDVGNWFEHKRHLQLQADAGALAGGGSFYLPCSDSVVEAEARKYAGDPTQVERYNKQVPHTQDANVHVLINSADFWNNGGVDYSDGGPPCAAKMVDVKITESNLPFFFGLGANFVPAINAHARVEIQALNTAGGALPVGVPDVNPTSARAWFVNEITGEVLASTPLTNGAPVSGLSVWDNSASPVSVPINGAHIGVRVAFSGGTSTTCGDPLVECYDLTAPDTESGPGIVYARGWSSAGSGAQPNPPLARSVTLFPGTCTDPYFSSASAACSIGVRAEVDFGGDPALVGAKLEATVGGTTLPLTYITATGLWESTGANFFTVNPGAGPLPVRLDWEETIGTVGAETCKTTGGNKCDGTFGTVQRAFSATEARSGPIKLAQIWESGSFWANSFEQGTTHDLVVKVGIVANLANAQSVSDPIVALRVIGGSQNQSLDCDNGPEREKLKDELALGCRPQYTKNTGTACPNDTNTLWGSPQPWPCVALQTGSATNQVPAGLNMRVLGSEKPSVCPPLGEPGHNNWSMFEDPGLPPGDPRIVQVFLTPFGSFDGSGNTTVPVTSFATFYVTGWTAQGGGFANPCQGNGDDPVPGNDAGYIVGHFIKYVFALNSGGGSGELCDFTSFGSCVAVLTH